MKTLQPPASDPHHDTDADGLHCGTGSVNDGFDGLTDPDKTEVHRVHASHDLMAEVAADLQHIADCLMVDTLDLEVPGIASVDDTGSVLSASSTKRAH